MKQPLTIAFATTDFEIKTITVEWIEVKAFEEIVVAVYGPYKFLSSDRTAIVVEDFVYEFTLIYFFDNVVELAFSILQI